MHSTTNLTPELLTTCVGPVDGPPEYAHLFKSIFECSAAGMLVLNAAGRCVSVNQAFCDLIGYTAEEVLTSTMPDITHPEDVALSMQALRRLTSGEAKGFQIEKRYNHKSGRAVWVLLTVTAIPRDDRLPSDLAVGVVHDISLRKAAEQALQRSDALFRTIAENAGDLILIVDYPERNTLYVSPAYEKLLGYSLDDLQKSNALTLVHPDDLPLIHQATEKMVREGSNAAITELRYRHKNGHWHYVEAHGCAVRNSAGDLERIVVISRLIDDRILARQKLVEREERLQLLLDSTAEAIFGVDLNGNCTFCNQALLRMLGYQDASGLLGKNMHQVIHHSHADGSAYPVEECFIYQAFRTGSVMHVDDEVVWRADATCLPVEYWSHPVKHEGETVGAMVTFVDITERKASQEALRRAHEEAELFINSVPSILIGISRDSRIQRWNLAAAQVFGLAAVEVAYKPLANCGIQWARADMKVEIDSWCVGRESRRIDALPFVIHDETRFLGLTLNWISAPEEQIDELLIIGSDVTDREILGQQLRQAQKLEAIGQLAPGIAHEINTPIQYVGDNTRFLQESWPSFHTLFALTREMQQQATPGPISPQTLERLDALAQGADFEYLQTEIPHAIEQSLEGIQRVAKIVRAMKEFSHPGSEEKKAIDINQAIETTITVAHSEWKYVADVETHFDPDLPLVLCHAGEFNQVILNLLINAAQAIAPPTGDSSQTKGKIVVSTMRDQDWAGISISDTGVGIPEAARSRIFEPFFTTKPVGKGTGQGLALAHTAIVRRHGGKIWFDSELGKGTTFHIRIPFAKPAEG
ncbi:MAG TPA: PAS domain S-box protein [Terriglobales bacterium]|nr:PAS domain S-box protein [Terriglobales bacterium]